MLGCGHYNLPSATARENVQLGSLQLARKKVCVSGIRSESTILALAEVCTPRPNTGQLQDLAACLLLAAVAGWSRRADHDFGKVVACSTILGPGVHCYRPSQSNPETCHDMHDYWKTSMSDRLRGLLPKPADEEKIH